MSTTFFDEFGLIRHLVGVASDAHEDNVATETMKNMMKADHCSNDCMLLQKIVLELNIL